MPAIRSHGAGCCGVSHIWNFGHYYGEQMTDETKEAFERQIADWKKNNASRLLEACLSDRQMIPWAPLMQAAGFKIVSRFVNSNSNNVVNVLHLISSEHKRWSKFKRVPPMPFNWETK